MCFYISDRRPEKKIATRNKKCWKTVTEEEDGYSSIWYVFAYQPNTLYSLSCPLEPVGRMINEGFHSYSTLVRARLARDEGEIIVKAIIPKGASYYESPGNSEYVSDAIIIIGEQS